MADTVDVAYLKSSHGERTRQGRCRGCRGDYPCQTLLAAQEIERLTAQRDAAISVNHGFRERAERAEEQNAELSNRLTDSAGGVYAEIQAERQRQDTEWGQRHDDMHTWGDWESLVARYADTLAEDARRVTGNVPRWRERMIQAAALAVAAVEWYDRLDEGAIWSESDDHRDGEQ